MHELPPNGDRLQIFHPLITVAPVAGFVFVIGGKCRLPKKFARVIFLLHEHIG